ncbi:type II toxin-antitoxin system Phd/YefM family antitoxin [Thioflavicoccus mobilis]|uniref:type II toxin-antitoxin system Phd/YefM family antitoxin n=1 Tax=Thioflavicoccus mobilis TaxID=80679 RepID=UPI001FE0BC52|nr:type II toxin-antitoxin system prevent-host-death family antitoxin [Thioflavicoccus mobilis]
MSVLEAKNQLSKLVKATLVGEEVIIASNGEAQVRLVPYASSPGLRHWGIWGGRCAGVDQAFTEEADAEVGRLFGKP